MEGPGHGLHDGLRARAFLLLDGRLERLEGIPRPGDDAALREELVRDRARVRGAQRRELGVVQAAAARGVDEHGLASVEYATAVLGTRLVLVLGQGQGGPSVAAKSQLSHRLAKAQSSAAELAGSDPLIAKSVASGQVKVLAGVHDLATGKVEILD